MEQQGGPIDLRGLHMANILCALAAFAAAAVMKTGLPARFPVHFDFSGNPDRWANADSLEWWLVPISAGLLAIFMGALAAMLPKMSTTYINVPRKDLLEQLPAPDKDHIKRMAAVMLLRLSVLDTLIFMAIQWLMYLKALGASPTPAIGALIAAGVLLIGQVVASMRQIKAEIQRRADS